MGWKKKRMAKKRAREAGEDDGAKRIDPRDLAEAGLHNVNHTPQGPYEFAERYALDNDKFTAYYKGHVVPDSEWDEFITTMRTPLPMSFRFQGPLEQSRGLRDQFEKDHVPNLQNLEYKGKKITPPSHITWMPERFAWRWPVTKYYLRQGDENVTKFRKWLIDANGRGWVARQEEVSMIPVCFLDVESHHKVLDMCAAPGSKTTQIIDQLSYQLGAQVPDGMIVANDADYKRCHMLAHTALRKRSTPSVAISNVDAGALPNIWVKDETNPERMVRMQYDRILADVPCTGDGTLRKAPDAWGRWRVEAGMGIHSLQVRIASRGFSALKPGGRMVYSTCSLNPLENEAVIAELLRRHKDMRIVDTTGQVPDLKRLPGLKTWHVVNRNTVEVVEKHWNDMTQEERDTNGMQASHFPPSPEEAEEMGLAKCMRVHPNLQDTGGFFITVLEKVVGADAQKIKYRPASNGADEKEGVPNDTDATLTVEEQIKKDLEEDKPKRHRGAGAGEEGFFRLQTDGRIESVLKKQYGFDETFPWNQLFTRNQVESRCLFTSTGIAALLQSPSLANLKVVNSGLLLGQFERTRPGVPDDANMFKFDQKALAFIAPYINRRLVEMPKDDVIKMLTLSNPLITQFSEDAQAALKPWIGSGYIVIKTKLGLSAHFGIPDPYYVCVWMGHRSAAIQMNKDERQATLLGLGLAEVKAIPQRHGAPNHADPKMNEEELENQKKKKAKLGQDAQ